MKAPTAYEIQRALDELSRPLLPPPCPFREYMIGRGFNPDDGDIMVLPPAWRDMMLSPRPNYVHFHNAVEDGKVYLLRGMIVPRDWLPLRFAP